MRPLSVILILMLLCGCGSVLVKEEVIDSKEMTVAKKNSTKSEDTKPVLYEGSLPSSKYSDSIKYPVLNLNTKYADNSNQMIQLLLTRALDIAQESSINPVMEFFSSENQSFTSLLVALHTESGDDSLCFNFNKESGVGTTADEIDKALGFEEALRTCAEDSAVSIYANEDNPYGVAKTLFEFWDMQSKGFPQFWVDGEILYGCFSHYNEKGEKKSELIPIEKSSSSKIPINALFFSLGGTESADLLIAKIDCDNKTLLGIRTVLEKKLYEMGYSGELPAIGEMKERSKVYFVVPKYRNTILRYFSEDSPSGNLEFCQCYLLSVSPNEKPPELIFRADISPLSMFLENRKRVIDISDSFK